MFNGIEIVNRHASAVIEPIKLVSQSPTALDDTVLDTEMVTSSYPLRFLKLCSPPCWCL